MRTLLTVLLSLMLGNALRAQYVYTINADSVKITNHCDTAELILENHTQTVPGFLFNKGRGRTEFRRVLQPLGSGTYLIGGDTLFAASNAWVQGGNHFGATGVLGTLDNNHLDFYTNNQQRLRLTNTGNVLLGATTDNGAKLQVNGSGTFAQLYTSPGTDTGYGLGHIYLNGAGINNTIGTYGHDMVFKVPTGATAFRFQFGNTSSLIETADDLNISNSSAGDVLISSSSKYINLNGVNSMFTDASPISIISNNYSNGDGVVIQRGPRSISVNDPILSLRDSITDMFKVLRNGQELITGNITALNPVHTIYSPTVTNSSDAYQFSLVTGMRITPTLNMTGDNQLAYAMDISPTYNLNGHTQYTDGISPALHIGSSFGGIRIDQTSSVTGNSGQPIYLYQGGTADKEEIVNYRNSTSTLRPIIWNIENRPAATRGSMIGVIRHSLSPDGLQAGAGINFSLDRYYYISDASIDMKYELAPVSNIDSTLKTDMAFNTVDSGTHSAAIFISGRKIGMGTTTPSAQLHTTGGVRFAGLTNDDTQTRIVVADASGNLYYRNASSLPGSSLAAASVVAQPLAATTDNQAALLKQITDLKAYILTQEMRINALEQKMDELTKLKSK